MVIMVMTVMMMLVLVLLLGVLGNTTVVLLRKLTDSKAKKGRSHKTSVGGHMTWTQGFLRNHWI